MELLCGLSEVLLQGQHLRLNWLPILSCQTLPEFCNMLRQCGAKKRVVVFVLKLLPFPAAPKGLCIWGPLGCIYQELHSGPPNIRPLPDRLNLPRVALAILTSKEQGHLMFEPELKLPHV